MSDRSITRLLLVEDNPVDVLMTRHALQEAKVYNNLYVTEDGEEAMDFLYRNGKYADAPRPDLILLDLNLPKKSGRVTAGYMTISRTGSSGSVSGTFSVSSSIIVFVASVLYAKKNALKARYDS